MNRCTYCKKPVDDLPFDAKPRICRACMIDILVFNLNVKRRVQLAQPMTEKQPEWDFPTGSLWQESEQGHRA